MSANNNVTLPTETTLLTATPQQQPPPPGTLAPSRASSLAFTPVSDIAGIVTASRKTWKSKKLLPLEKRKANLHSLIKMIDDNMDMMKDAVYSDLRKSGFEFEVMELAMVRNDIWLALSRLDEWAGHHKVEVDATMALENIYTKADPLGVVLIIGAWNYPFQLCLAGLVGSIAAGNSTIIKPSEVSTHSAECITRLIGKYFAPGEVTCINGGIPETTEVLAQRFDHILYTGNGMVARIVMAAASKNLTPVTLELGGKSPCIVDDKCDLTLAARRIVWGRVANAGQTCIAPDYIMVKPKVKAAFVEALKKALKSFLGEDPASSKDYCRIVNGMHFNRICGLMKGGKIIHGGRTDESSHYIEPTIIDDVDLSHKLMKDEIFGPLFPLVNYNTVDEAIDFINDRDKPLALYIFSTDNSFVKKVIDETSSGDVTVNDTLIHASIESLPFGGVGESGMGAYHGKLTFDILSHRKGVMARKQNMEFVNDMRYPPYSNGKLKRVKMLLHKNGTEKPWIKVVVIVVLCLIIVLVALYFILDKMGVHVF